jgi:hypothetical protein
VGSEIKGVNLLVRRLLYISAVLMICGGVVSVIVDIARGPPNLAAGFIFVMLIGFSLLPMSGALEWYLPSGKLRGYGRKRSLAASTILVVALAYWIYAIIESLSSTTPSFPLIGTGAILSALGWFMYLYVDVTRENKELR